MYFKFSLLGLIIFLLPMPVNILYMLLPPRDSVSQITSLSKLLDFLEQGSRILFAAALCFLQSGPVPTLNHWLFYFALAFLLLYMLTWLRYFTGGRKTALLGKPFLKLPIPLAIFPVLYYLCSAFWLKNYIALGCILIFGIVHCFLTYQTFYKNAPSNAAS